MKYSIFFLMVGVFQVMAEVSYSQTTKLTLDLQGVTVAQAIKQIENVSQFYFTYNTREINPDRIVSVHLQNNDIYAALKQLFAGENVNYVVADKHVVLYKEGEKMYQGNVQQGISITGTVTDNEGAPLPGASVVLKGTSQGTVTDSNGAYSLSVPNENAVLIFSFVGYATQEMNVGSQRSINISLSEDTSQIEEVVVVGYGVQRKVTATGAVSKVEGSELSRLNVANTTKSLQGITSGIILVDRGGRPGSDNPDIYLRGLGTTGNSSPLILVDGIERDLNNIPVQEIENISILKDASSASIYGSRAAHGVILVTTKRGSAGKMKVSYNGYVGFQDLSVRPKLVSAREYFEMVNESQTNVGNAPLYSEEVISKTESGVDPINYPYTKWVDEIYKKDHITQHTLNISGGNEAGRYMMMIDYLNQPGLSNNLTYERYNYRLKADLNIGRMIRVSSDMAYIYQDRLQPQGGDMTTWVIRPNMPVKYANGEYALTPENINPVASTDFNVVGKTVFQTHNIIGQGKVEFEPVKDLVFTGVVAMNTYFDREHRHNRNHRFYNANDVYVTQWNATNSVLDTRNNRSRMTMRFLANYRKKLAGIHEINLLYGMEQITYRNYYSRAERRNLISDDLPDVSLGSASTQFSEGSPSMHGINSFFGRIGYVLKDKYMFEANIRADGSSRFAKGKKWGTFPSVSAGWRLSEEAFLKDVSFISNLKLRASWGQTGNERIDNFQYVPQYSTSNVIMNGATVSGITQSRMSNANITWETVELTDIGLDFAFLGNQIFGELDYYSKDTKDILLNLAIPQFIGLSAPAQNAGIVRNSGVELMLGYRANKREFKWSVTANASYNKNQWVDRGSDETNINGWTINTVGSPLNAFYVYDSDRLIANDQELADYKAKYKSDPRGMAILKAGDVRLVDVNGDGTIDPDDRIIKDPNIPKFNYGLTFNAEYKNFDLNLFFQGTGGAWRYIQGEWYEGPSYEKFVGLHFRDRWTIENQNGNAYLPRLETGNNRNINTYNKFYLRNISYLRLKNAQLGYTIPSHLTQKLNIERVRIYVSGYNLLTFSKLDQGIDPEGASGRTNDFLQTKTVTFGINVNF